MPKAQLERDLRLLSEGQRKKVLLAASLLLCGPLQACFPRLKKALYAKEAPGLPGMVGLLVLLFLSLMRVTAGTYSAFIYFQF